MDASNGEPAQRLTVRLCVVWLALWCVVAACSGGCAHLAGEVTGEVVEVGTDTSLQSLSTYEHRQQLAQLTELVSRNIALGIVGGLREGLETGLPDDLDDRAYGFVDGLFGRLGTGLRTEILPVVAAMSGVAGEHLMDAVLSRGDALVGLVARLGAVGVDAALDRLAWGLEHQLVPILADAIERQLGPALARTLEHDLGPALARTLDQDLGPALATVLRRDLVGALDDDEARRTLAEASYAIGSGLARGAQDVIGSSGAGGGDGAIDIDEIGDNLDYISYWVLAAIGTAIILMIVLIVGTTLRIVQGVREGMMDEGSPVAPQRDPHSTQRRDVLLEALLLNMVLRNGHEDATSGELRAALDARLRELADGRHHSRHHGEHGEHGEHGDAEGRH